jgi:serine/threonine protein kinase/Flp pilus assembly protein TadD
MNVRPEVWARVKAVFEGALELEGAARFTYVAGACAEDVEVRRHVERLLASHDRAATFLEQSALVATHAPPDDLTGRLVSNYRIQARLGAGGMGEVYKAQDPKLDRPVALKLLPIDLAVDTEHLQRFHAEARAASSLNHPNILVVHDFGEHDGRPFMVTEYVEGQTLRQRLARGPMPIRELLDVAAQIASALAAAHERGVLHRDIKPENVMIWPDGYVKVLDFGLAKLLAPDELATVAPVQTRQGLIMGTPQYMSPEQARAERVDFRSDQFSFGALLYELATGRAPFARGSIVETAAAVIADEAEALDRACPHMPPALRRIIERCLTKKPGGRYDSTRDLHRELVAIQERPAEVAAALRPEATARDAIPSKPDALAAAEERAITSSRARLTLAVLPFENLSGDSDREYLADGLVEETIASLGQVDPDRLSVVGRTSVMVYKRTTKSLAEIGRELGADYLLESSIRAGSNRLRITAKLIRVRDQIQVWSESYNREATNILGLQEELSLAIAEQIRSRLSPDRLKVLARRQPRNADAYDLYLRGRNFEKQRTPPTTQRAIEYYQRATALDPEYALAWSGLAFTYAARSINSDASPLEVWPRAREAALRAVRANPNLSEAQLALGYVTWLLGWDWPTAERVLRRAVDLNPHQDTAHQALGHALSQMGRHSEAQPAMRRARELDPLYAMPYAMSSQVAFQARDYRGALDYANQAIALDQEFWIGHVARGSALEQLGQDELALQALTIAARFSGVNSKTISLRGYVLAKLGHSDEARGILTTLETVSEKKYVPPYALALVHAGLGEREAVFDWLGRAYGAHDVHLIYLPC